jgi:hypothetical protein
MRDDEVVRWLSKEEAWAWQSSQRRLVEEHTHVSNPDGTPRTSYIAGPWHATIAALRSLASTRASLKKACVLLFDDHATPQEIRDFVTKHHPEMG